ncbi:bacteriohemerythrin [Pseudobacteriovorax antillogorgiicola]|uniref:Hemerythrin-like metal-binding domain protein n=1 Tax=Pseudobacteriovorax antillogorgiicola TaxID=1513793 RepID=A0A1Y6CCJ6_9BACT|nr:bacteriohemerythrin [Pseudobacteriovorax antillogorgiicola]TCS48319.1 hemerythrin-like metal-binding protein [Pseudobacteriovorax antillogorgiicola]SMF56617.1 hemerythrin-like metal-binding domain protein [Pseudobacteriovorax antillogorgiicola]
MDWKPEYNVGVDYLDEQHKAIVEGIRHLSTEFENEQGLRQAVSELFELIRTHFRHEEIILLRHGYRDREKHEEIHSKFLDGLGILEQKFAEVGSDLLPTIIDFLSQWFHDHFTQVDQKYAEIVGKFARPA